MQFLKFGLLAWGGPAAQIAMIRAELVDKQAWITPEKFRRALAVYQALPGPEAHELCVYFGMVRAGRWGGFLAGLGFMLPGFVLMLALSWMYMHFGQQALLPLFVGVAPAVAALIVRATHRIGGHILVSQPLWIAAIVAAGLTLLGVHFIWVFVLCGVWNWLWGTQRRNLAILTLLAASTLAIIATYYAPAMPMLNPFHGTQNLLLEGLKAGLLSFGGAYTSIPFLQNAMVDVYPNVNAQSFLDSIALSNVIPAPLIIFGTFLGYIAGGFPGAGLMTLGIFTPAFGFTLLGHTQLEKLIENRTFHAALDGISAAVVGLLAVTATQIAITTVHTPRDVVLFCAALAAFFMFKSKWAVPLTLLACGVVGYIMKYFIF